MVRNHWDIPVMSFWASLFFLQLAEVPVYIVVLFCCQRAACEPENRTGTVRPLNIPTAKFPTDELFKSRESMSNNSKLVLSEGTPTVSNFLE
jgi:hypothetical protein